MRLVGRSSDTRRAYRRIFSDEEVAVTYLFVILALAALAYAGWRAIRVRGNQANKRVIGPDDDPEFLWRLTHGDNNPR
jgi:hypothetical protein